MSPVQYVIGIDLGGTNLRAMLFEVQDNQLVPCGEKQKYGIDATSFEDIFSKCKHGIVSLVTADGGIDAKANVIVGFSAPGPLDHTRRQFLNPPNLPALHNVSIDRLVPVEWSAYLVRDTFAAVLAEHKYGAGQGVNDLVYITVSTGIGAGIIANGQLLMGAKGVAAEFGHIRIRGGHGPRCGCGDTHHVEAYASGNGIAWLASDAFRLGIETPSSLQPIYRENRKITCEEVYEAASNGDMHAKWAFEDAGRALGEGLATLVTLINPARIVIGGGVWENAEQFMRNHVETGFRAGIMHSEYLCDIVTAELGKDVGIWGAAHWALTHYNQEHQAADSSRMIS